MNYDAALQYVENYWSKIIHRNAQDNGTLIGLPRPYLIPRERSPNSGMFQEMYYWDSFFISLGLMETAHESLVVDTCENFAYLIERFGMIPNGSRYYFLSRSQPPFFTQQIKLAQRTKDTRVNTAWLTRMLALAEREHNTVWLGTTQPQHRNVHRGLSRYFDINYLHILASCESGWDHSTRCDEAWLDHLPIDLNSILYAREQDMAALHAALGNPDRAQYWRTCAEARQRTIHELMWDEDSSFFYDYNFVEKRKNKLPTLAGFYPLWAGLATQPQAEKMVASWLPKFLHAGGLVASLDAGKDKQWAFPNGWAPLQWLVATGLSHYGFVDEARAVRKNWCDNCATVFAQTGAFWEKYNVANVGATDVEQGVYGQLAGFGWSNAVFKNFVTQDTQTAA